MFICCTRLVRDKGSLGSIVCPCIDHGILYDCQARGAYFSSVSELFKGVYLKLTIFDLIETATHCVIYFKAICSNFDVNILKNEYNVRNWTPYKKASKCNFSKLHIWQTFKIASFLLPSAFAFVSSTS